MKVQVQEVLTWNCPYFQRLFNVFRKAIVIQHTKNGNPKTIPLNRIALNVLLKKSSIMSIKNDLVFTNPIGTMIKPANLRLSFGIAVKKAGIKDFCFHDLRHTFATLLAQSGVDLYKISKLLGHSDIKMSQRYAHHYPESLRDGVDILGKSDYNLTTIAKKKSSYFKRLKTFLTYLLV